MMKHPKTTLAGVAMILGAIANVINEIVGGTPDIVSIKASIGAMIAGAGLVMAHDAK